MSASCTGQTDGYLGTNREYLRCSPDALRSRDSKLGHVTIGRILLQAIGMADQENRSIPIVLEKAGVQLLMPSAIFTIPSVCGLWTPAKAGVTGAGFQACAPVGNDNASAKDHREGFATRRVRRQNGSEKLSKRATVATDRIRHNEHCMDDYGDCKKAFVAMHEWGHARRL